MIEKQIDFLNDFFKKKNCILLIVFFLSLLLYMRLPVDQFRVYFILLIGIAIISLLRSFNLVSCILKKGYKKDPGFYLNLKRRIILSILFIFVFLMARNTFGSKWFIDNIDNATYLYLSYIPLVFIFRLSPEVTALISFFLLIFMSLYSLSNFEIVAETFAILAYLFFSTAVFHQVILLSRGKKEDDA